MGNPKYDSSMTFEQKLNYYKSAYSGSTCIVLLEFDGKSEGVTFTPSAKRRVSTRARALEFFQDSVWQAKKFGYTRIMLIRGGVVMAQFETPEAELFPGGDAAPFPMAHPRPTDEDTPRSPAGGGNPETLDAEYCEWSDQVNQGWTAAETIIELRRQNGMLHDIVGGLREQLAAAEREVAFLRHRPAVYR